MRRLLIRPGGIGDTILAFPALEHLKTDYTEVWVRADVVPLVRFADRVRAIASTSLDLLELPDTAAPPGLIDCLRSFDSIVSWYGTNRPEFRDRAKALGLPVRFLDALPPSDSQQHAADFFLRQAGGSAQSIPKIQCEVERRDFVAIHPFSGGVRKNWPLPKFYELARRLKTPVEWCASPEQVLDGARKFEDLSDLARWLGQARAYVGNDSGITHLAAAVGTPVVAIFGPSDPAVWAPRGERVRIVNGLLADIALEEVCAAVDEVLNPSGG